MPARPDHIHVSPDPTPGPHRTDSLETICWWTPFLGPTATIAATHLCQHAQSKPHVPIDVNDLRTMLGLGDLGGRVWRALDRLEQFGAIKFHSTDTITVRTYLGPLGPKELAKLPGHFADAYRHILA